MPSLIGLDEEMYQDFEPIFQLGCGNLLHTILNNIKRKNNMKMGITSVILREVRLKYKSTIL